MSNRSILANRLAAEFDMSKKDGAILLEDVTKILKAHLLEEGEAVLPGFGRIRLQVRASRMGHNPRTRETITIPEKIVFKFKPFPGALTFEASDRTVETSSSDELEPDADEASA